MEIRIDHGTCIGAGQCTLTAPAVFTQDDAGYATLVPGAPRPRPRGRSPRPRCPVQAIVLGGDPPDA
ncbi:ferredoxin [Streptomyces sp. NPDC096105]|uniref:ferredoxin n=1 Tax=Streptomyces sp. NPDC096105 TaxID=3366074 RepID=UPI003821CC95